MPPSSWNKQALPFLYPAFFNRPIMKDWIKIIGHMIIIRAKEILSSYRCIVID